MRLMGISRRDLFRGAWRRGQNLARDLHRATKRDRTLEVLQRPPGAIAEGQFLGACTRCSACVDVCPPDALRPAEAMFGANRAGTPYIDATVQPCVMCTDLPCIEACEPGVLTHGLPVRMAETSIHEGGCLAWQGERCRVCADACPVEDAILLDPGDRPRIDPSTCTGCGTCLHVCPVGTNGVHFTPVDARPFHPLPPPSANSPDA